MTKILRFLTFATLSLWLLPALAQGKGVERLYILNCGEGVAGDISRWSPGVMSASRWISSITVI